MTRVAIVGSRPEYDSECPDRAAEERDYRREKAIAEYVASLPPDTVVVSGGADGADRWAHLAAKRHAMITVVVFPAWKRRDGSINMAAGIKRNAVIVDIADRIVAFWDGQSRGTASTIELARKAGKPVEVVR